MEQYRIWGKPPYNVVVVHGGPGAPGSIAPAARELSKDMGVLEPFESAGTVEGQIKELAGIIKTQAEIPVTLIGWSWGATLSYLTAARYPELVKKLILIGASPIIARKGPRPEQSPAYLERLSEAERVAFFSIVQGIWEGKPEERNEGFRKLCGVIAKAEIFKPTPAQDDVIEYQFDINQSIGRELNEIVQTDMLVEAGKKISCPVTAIQGDYDTNPANEVKEALSSVIKDFKFILLEKCGHSPWFEKYARDEFFKILRAVI